VFFFSFLCCSVVIFVVLNLYVFCSYLCFCVFICVVLLLFVFFYVFFVLAR